MNWPGDVLTPAAWAFPLRYHDPHTLLNGGAHDHPLGTGNLSTLEQFIINRNAGNLEWANFTSCIPLQQVPQSTKAKSHTIVQGGSSPLALERILQCMDMNRRFAAYAGSDPNAANDNLNTTYQRISQNGYRLPSPMDYLDAAAGVASWFSLHISRRKQDPAIPIGSEPASQDEFVKQIIGAVDWLLQMRYAPTHNPNDFTHLDVPGAEKVTLREGAGTAHYPRWGRSVQLKNADEKAGQPDFVLFSGILPRQHVAVAEIKTFWSNTTDSLERIFCDGGHLYLGNQTGVFNWLWREMLSHASYFALWTNGEVVIFCVRSGDHEITFSEPLSWRHHSVIQTVTGFSMLALDVALMDPQGRQTFIDHLVNGKNANWGWDPRRTDLNTI
ncbi:hypothetical protein PUNSTDRAFT_45414 [Punctularia strigosozonata HHB-11173 SS5]|uniref:uncharacterized protein n=1 Tax=Punctularia strigosozonata (strain HHB-11173) TaxID=741275 RepID=UPI0004417857|nr:uncharacterized protein PUNSTDRAFT_45414 [Punctularia strigosozonata HHB-11173 SS5]EIN07997.1 hypothetical protein PUNSTDRAFT_45414 [Punctularia strigosozonata HHB-11173 SS5]